MSLYSFDPVSIPANVFALAMVPFITRRFLQRLRPTELQEIVVQDRSLVDHPCFGFLPTYLERNQTSFVRSFEYLLLLSKQIFTATVMSATTRAAIPMPT